MSPRASKRSSGGSRKKKLPEDSETVDGKKPKKAKTTKKVNVCVDETKGDEIGANSDNKKDTPQCSSNSEIKEFTQDQSKLLFVLFLEYLNRRQKNSNFCCSIIIVLSFSPTHHSQFTPDLDYRKQKKKTLFNKN